MLTHRAYHHTPQPSDNLMLTLGRPSEVEGIWREQGSSFVMFKEFLSVFENIYEWFLFKTFQKV